ncbi:cupin domain-containing protein [Kitasatospora azatica]|uniref:cupin domain-containing protein n=1 Tax=Kitasatospora azatica TaxID=58347 RepID=UPI000568D5B7|nr:cupin domain-containing protein [Kitasatospora azatica]
MSDADESAALPPWVELGTELLVDQPGLKCWMETVRPGETRPAHTHRHPWVTVVLSGAAGNSLGPDGEVLSKGELTTGQVVFNSGEGLPIRHAVHNTSDRTLVTVAIEIAGPWAVAEASTEGLNGR